MAPFDIGPLIRHCKDSSCTVFQLLTLNNIVTLKSELEITQGHVVIESLGAVSYWPSIVTMALSCIISEIKRHIDQKS